MADINYSKDTTFPRQKLPRTSKDKEWGIENVKYIMNLTSFNSITTGRRNSFEKKKINYDLYNNIINEEDFKYVTNPYGIEEKLPARLDHYNILTPKLKLLEGEEIKRPFNFRIVAVNQDAVSEAEEKKKEMLLMHLESELVASLQQQGINVQAPEEAQSPEQVQKYASYSMSSMRELTANRLAEYLIKQQNLEFKFNKGFKHSLITAEEFYYVGIEGGEPIVEVVNPLDFDYDKNPDKDFIEDGQWAAHTKFCTPGEILDLYGEELTEEQVEQIDSRNVYNTVPNMGMGPATGPITMTTVRPSIDNNARDGYIRVTRVEWKSMRKIGYLTSYDPQTLEKIESIVDETYKPVKERGEEVEWLCINEVWEGTLKGSDIYVRIKPKTVQYRSIDNPSACKLGYCGAIHNALNAEPTSMMDLGKNHQYLYDIVVFRLQMELAKAKGKKMVMDIAQVPRSMGIPVDKWMYYFDTLGIAWINSFEEGKGKFQGQTSSFNQFSQIDMSLSQSVQQYIGIMNKLEEMVAELLGVTKQRLGAISSSETVGGVERAVQQSSHVTEPLFYLHNEVKKNVVTQLIECAKVAYPEGKKVNYIMDDMSRTILTIGEDFLNADYGVFVTNGAKEVQALEQLRQLAQQAISSGMISLKEAAVILKSESISQIDNIIDQAVDKADQAKQQEQQHEQEMQQQQLAMQQQMQDKLQDRLDQREVLKGEIGKEEAYIKTFGGKNASPEDDNNSNGTPDVLEYAKLSAEQQRHRDNITQQEKQRALEEKKLAVQQSIAKQKAEVDKIKANKSKTSK